MGHLMSAFYSLLQQLFFLQSNDHAGSKSRLVKYRNHCRNRWTAWQVDQDQTNGTSAIWWAREKRQGLLNVEMLIIHSACFSSPSCREGCGHECGCRNFGGITLCFICNRQDNWNIEAFCACCISNHTDMPVRGYVITQHSSNHDPSFVCTEWCKTCLVFR